MATDFRSSTTILEQGDVFLLDDLGEDLGIELPGHPADLETALVFRDLHLRKSARIKKPLFERVWE